MGIKELFEGQATKEKKSAVLNVIKIMAADGKVDPREMSVLSMVCKRVGMKEKELEKLLKNTDSVKFIPPDSDRERLRQLLDMVLMMMADGRIDRREIDICTHAAARLGFSPAVVPKVVKDIIAGAQNSRPRDRVIADVEVWLNN